MSRQTSCRRCGHDIEGARHDWHDRGGNAYCPEFCGYNEDGVPIYRPAPRHVPQPLRAPPVAVERWAPDRPGRPRLT